MSVLMDGLHVPLTAPFYRDGQSYLRKLEHNVGRYSLTPAAGLVALLGEGAALSDAEMRETFAAITEFAAPEKVLVAAIAKESVREALRVAEEAALAEFDAVVVSAPAGLSLAEKLLLVRAVADASPLPVMVQGGGLAVEVIAELAGHPGIIGMYDAGLTLERYGAIAAATRGIEHEATVTTVFAPVTRRMLRPVPAEAGSATFVTAESLAGGTAMALAVAPAKPAIRTRVKKVGFQVMAAGPVAGLVALLEAGVPGALPRLAACAPQSCYEAFAAFKDGDPRLAAEKEHRLLTADALLAELGIAGVKYGCDLNGYYGGTPRLPRLALTTEAKERVERVLAGLRN
jgi:dihydrodipicolinate synthase/N-acetylneuraminate lyase